MQAPSTRLPVPVADMVGKALAQPKVRLSGGGTCWLDPLLGDEWSVLHFRPDGQIQILTEASSEARSAIHVVNDLDGHFKSVAGRGAYLLVRPDRYVAAACATFDELKDAVAGFARLLPHLGQSLGLSTNIRDVQRERVAGALA